MLFSAVFSTRDHVDCRKMFGRKAFSTFKKPPLSESIIWEILKLGGLSFLKKKCSKFDVDLRKEVKIAGKSVVFEIMPFGSCRWKFCTFRREYLSSVANVLTNGPKVSTLTMAIVFQLYLSHIHWKIR